MGDSIAELKWRARQSAEHFRRLVDLAIKGVPGAREALEGLAPPGDEQPAEGSDPGSDRQAFWAELLEVKELLNTNPDVGELGDLRCRGRHFGACEEVQAIGLEAYRVRRLGLLGASERLLEDAWALSGGCLSCQLDVKRRQAIQFAGKGAHSEALELIDWCIAGYRRHGPGHDLDGDGLANSLGVRAKIRDFLGDMRGAVADLGASLERWPLKSAPFMIGLLNLGVALERSGLREEAYLVLRPVRLKFRAMPAGAHRAVFDLLDGQLEHERGSKHRDRAREKILAAVHGFAEVSMPDEFLRASADYLKAARGNPQRVQQFLREIHPIAKRLVTAPEHLRRLQEILNLSKELSGPLPSRAIRLRLGATMEQAIGALRAGIASPGLPCLVS